MENEEEFELTEYTNPPVEIVITVKVSTITWAVTVGLLIGLVVYLLVYIAGGF